METEKLVSTEKDSAVAALYQRRTAEIGAGGPEVEEPAVDAAAALQAEPAIDIEAVADAARAELGTVGLDEHPAPFIASVPQSLKDQIPSTFYRRHDWSADVASRRVNLNGEEMAEGDQVAQGLRLLEILPDSCVLDFQGEQFRLKALNSWINL